MALHIRIIMLREETEKMVVNSILHYAINNILITYTGKVGKNVSNLISKLISRHQMLPLFNSQVTLSFPSVVRLAYSFLVTTLSIMLGLVRLSKN